MPYDRTNQPKKSVATDINYPIEHSSLADDSYICGIKVKHVYFV